MTKLKISDSKITKLSLFQAYSHGFEYAVLNKNNELVTPFCTCKDYFNDMFWSIINKKPSQIFGFKFDPAKPGLDIDMLNMRIAVRDKDKTIKEFLPMIENSVKFINASFKKISFFPKIEIMGTGPYDAGEIIVLNFPPQFIVYPPIMSTFLLYIRGGQRYNKKINKLITTPAKYVDNLKTIGSYTSADTGDMQHSRKLINSIHKNGLRAHFKLSFKDNYSSTEDISTVHNRYGIRSYALGAFLEVGKKLLHEYMGEKNAKAKV